MKRRGLALDGLWIFEPESIDPEALDFRIEGLRWNA